MDDRTSDEIRREMYALNADLLNQITALKSSVKSVQEDVGQLTTVTYAEVVNIVDDGAFQWSEDAYLNIGVLPSDTTDSNFELYHYFRFLRSDNPVVNSADAVKAEGHSTFAANEGTDADIIRWNRPDANIAIGGVTEDWDLCYPLHNNPITAGNTVYVQLEAMLATSDPPPDDLQLFAGIWDSTSGQEKYIDGATFTITGEIFNPDGLPGSDTVEYQVRAANDSGEETFSQILTFTNAPATFTQNHHPRISFKGAPGFIEFDIYRHKDGVYVLQYVVKNSIDSTYFDTGNPPIKTVMGFPSPSATAPRAYAKTITFVPGAIGGRGFVRYSLTIFVPTTYDKTQTDADSQWLRLGLTNPTDVANQILFRKLALSFGDGMWSPSANDKLTGTHSTPSSTPASSPAGGGGQGTGTPPDPGTGNAGTCVLLDSLIYVFDKNKKYFIMPLSEIRAHLLNNEELYAESGGVCGRILGVKTGHVSKIIHIETENRFKLSATPDHSLITDFLNFNGTAVKR
jgi:hypothetical protein